jgi:geranylgeranyl pyrophosphate synthase
VSTTTRIDRFLLTVDETIRASLEHSALWQSKFDSRLLVGKGLRARFAFYIGNATRTPLDELIAITAAVETFHTASLLHDDVIDGATVRRGVPTDWIERGTSASILTGDRLLIQSLQFLQPYRPRLTERFLAAISDVCEAEIEHEALIGAPAPPPEQILGIARRKTGSLFAFLGVACAPADARLGEAIESCAYAFGMAYQLADDLLDCDRRAEAAQQKTLGLDRRRGKVTLAEMSEDLHAGVARELACCAKRLGEWPAVHSAWVRYRREVTSLANHLSQVVIEGSELDLDSLISGPHSGDRRPTEL